MTPQELRLNLTDEQIIQIMKGLGVEDFIEDARSIQFPTICHNAEIDSASKKLYYYRDTKLFHCYTQCGDTFNIFELIRRYYEARGVTRTFYEIFSQLCDDFYCIPEHFEYFIYQPRERTHKRELIELPAYSTGVLETFVKTPPREWLAEGITGRTIEKYNIRLSLSQQKIVIPHYDAKNRLVGIRGRALREEDLAYGKYRPITVQNITYTHPLSLNLYGLNHTASQITYGKTIVVFESEKSVMLMDSYFGDKNNSVAVCGSNFNKNQLLLLLKTCKVNQIVLAFDKEYQSNDKVAREKYLKKLRTIGQKYSNYCDFYYLADKENLLDYKDSPIDKGPEVFNYLLSKKMYIRS